MKTLIFTLLVVLFVSCKKETTEPDSLFKSIKTWYNANYTLTFVNDTLITINEGSTTNSYTYKLKQDSLLLYRKTFTYRYKYIVNQDSLCFYQKSLLTDTYYSHKK